VPWPFDAAWQEAERPAPITTLPEESSVFATLLPILGITFIDILGFSILIPILPFYAQHYGASDVVIGVLFSVFAACQFIAGPIWGNVSDRIGRKRVLIISQVGATIGWTMLALAPTLVWVFIARIVEGISGGNIGVTQAYVADRVKPEDRARAFGYVGASFSAGFVLGPAAAAILLSRFGYMVPLLLAAALQLVTLLTTIFFLPEQIAEKGEAQHSSSFRDIPRAFQEPRVAPVLVQKLSYSLGLFAWFAVFALVLQKQLGFDGQSTSYAFAAFGLVGVVMQLFVVGMITDAIGNRAASNVGFASLLAFFALIPLVHSVIALLGVLVLFSLGMSLTNATIAALLTQSSPDSTRGTVLSVGDSMQSIAGIIMPAISTGVLAYYGTGWTAAIPLVFVVVALALGLAAQRAKTPLPSES
jgi:MFS transporter, DHA1 family, tetracycline resistance protein